MLPQHQKKRPRRLQLKGRGQERAWHVYIIRCSDQSLYTGITTDIERRYRQHLEGTGARYFWGRKPRRMVYVETGHTRSSAAKREYEIKSLTRVQKDNLIRSFEHETGHAVQGRRKESKSPLK